MFNASKRCIAIAFGGSQFHLHVQLGLVNRFGSFSGVAESLVAGLVPLPSEPLRIFF